jgi:hypothetical protein
MKYHVVLNDYIKKESTLLKCFNEKYNALDYLENYTKTFIESKHGSDENRFRIHIEPSSINSNSWSHYAFGYHVCRNIRESVHKQVIYEKILLPGLLYSSYEIKKIFSIDMIIAKSNIIQPSEINTDCDIDIKDYYITEVLPELLNNHEKEISNCYI